MVSREEAASPSGERQCRAAWKYDPSVRCELMASDLTRHAGDHLGEQPGTWTRVSWSDDDAQIWVEPDSRPPCATCRGMVSGVCHRCGRVRQPTGFGMPESLLDGYREAGMIPPEVASSTQVGGSHYLRSIQPWEIIEVWELDYFRGRALTYLLRAGNKGPALEDLKKARHLLDHLIEKGERGDGE